MLRQFGPKSSSCDAACVVRLVGHNIRIHCHAKGVSQTELAERLGVTFQQVQKYEGGVNRVGAGRLTRIAAVLGVPVTALLDGVEGGSAESPLALIAERQPYRLAAAYARIADRRLRRAVVALVEQIARQGG
jgi:transcriptional regulator with XRE-family HTH domain